MENHGESRYIVDGGDAATKAAAGAVFTLPGVPMLYGGQELGQRGRRDSLAWDHARDEIQDHYDQLIDLKQAYPALGSNGDLQRVDYDADDDDQVVAFGRENEDNRYIVILNFDEGETVVGVEETVDATDLVSGESRAAEEGLTVDSVGVFEAAD